MNMKVNPITETSCISNTGLIQTSDNAQYNIVILKQTRKVGK